MFTISLVLGLLLIPLSAVAAVALISSDDESTSTTVQAEVVVGDVPEVTVTTTEPVEAKTVFVTEAPTATGADLEAACGDDALELVEREADETITELEQAALDALRQICRDEGLAVPGPPAPAPVVRTVTVVNSTPNTTAAPSSSTQGTAVDDSQGDSTYVDDDDHGDDDHGDDDQPGDED